ncbi:MAG: hypothetical protein LBG13_00490 [Holosporales bacterium]|jgi:hypothetical protein|nr:hypothetical protein [Holosporales bacterium]
MRKILVVASMFLATFATIGYGADSNEKILPEFCDNSDGNIDQYYEVAEIKMDSAGFKGDSRKITLYYDCYGYLYYGRLNGVITRELKMEQVPLGDPIRNVVFLNKRIWRYVCFDGANGRQRELSDNWFLKPENKIYYLRPKCSDWFTGFYKHLGNGNWTKIDEYNYTNPENSVCNSGVYTYEALFENLDKIRQAQAMEDPK